MVGKQYKGDLMVVGRAVNGWIKGLQPHEFMDNEKLTYFLDNVFESVTETCPMQWVSRSWENSEDYNTKSSAFWRVIRRVVHELEIADVESEKLRERLRWPSYLVWSNLYKFAPEGGGNPSATLCNVQLDECKSLIQKEIQAYKPKRILFLTGLDWAEPFIAPIAAETVAISGQQYVEAVARLDASQGLQGCIVVAAHPGRKKMTGLEKS